MNQTEQFEKLKAYIDSAQDIGLFVHVNPDGDCLGSALALYLALKKLGKTVSIYSQDAVPKRLITLPAQEQVQFRCETKHALAIAVDCATLDRLGVNQKAYMRCKTRISVDHHSCFERFYEFGCVERDCGATAEILYKFFRKYDLMDKTIAHCLIVGIITDTGCFSFSSTSEQTHRIAAELYNYDLDVEQIIYKTYREREKSVFDLSNRVLSEAKFYENGKIGLITFFKKHFEETGTDKSDTDGIIASVIAINGVEIAFALSEREGKNFNISIRTKNNIDASECATQFGGGGHCRAAGCRLSGYYEDIIDKLLKAARDRL